MRPRELLKDFVFFLSIGQSVNVLASSSKPFTTPSCSITRSPSECRMGVPAEGTLTQVSKGASALRC